jgi:hypothetical protein
MTRKVISRARLRMVSSFRTLHSFYYNIAIQAHLISHLSASKLVLLFNFNTVFAA